MKTILRNPVKTQLYIGENQKELKEHGHYDFPVRISLEHIQSYEQDSFLWHWHPEIELTWIISGSIQYQVNDTTHILCEGDGLFCNSSTLHSGCRKDDDECTYLSLTFHPRFLYGYESSILHTKYIEYITTNDDWSSLKFTSQVPWQNDIIQRIRNIYDLSLDRPEDYELQVHILLMEIWQRIYRHLSSLPKIKHHPQKHLQRLRKIISFIQDNYNQELSLDDISDHVNICKSECCRFFKKYMNMTIFEYILFLKIQNSLPYLKDGESVTKTAELVGFSSPAYYGQIFKRYMKCTPKAYSIQVDQENH